VRDTGNAVAYTLSGSQTGKVYSIFASDISSDGNTAKYVFKKFTVVNDGSGTLTFTDGAAVYKTQSSS